MDIGVLIMWLVAYIIAYKIRPFSDDKEKSHSSKNKSKSKQGENDTFIKFAIYGSVLTVIYAVLTS